MKSYTKSRTAKRLVITVAIGAPLSLIGVCLAMIGAHAGDLFLWPAAALCPLPALLMAAIGQLGVRLRNDIYDALTTVHLIIFFCFLQFLCYYLVVLFVERTRGPILLLRQRLLKKYPEDHCQSCGYDLAGNVSGACPECGTAVAGWQHPPSHPPPAADAPEDAPSPTKSRRKVVIAGIVSAVLVAGIALAYHYSRVPEAFNKEKWHSASVRDRARMAGDLVGSGMLVGMTHEEVADLLGEPDDHSLLYELGTECLLVGHVRKERSTEIFGSSQGTAPRPIPFDQEVWNTLAYADRAQMAVNLREHPEWLSGKTADQIVSILGPPNTSETRWYSVGIWGKSLFVSLKNNRVAYVDVH